MKVRPLFATMAILLAMGLMASACSDSDSPALGDGSLGRVTLGPGEAVQFRSLSLIEVSGDGMQDMVYAVQLAINDYGPIHGRFTVEVGEGINDACSADYGPTAAEAVLADARTVGVIGSSCSGTASTAAPILSEAGLVMISMSNTSPLLTSDLAGNPGEFNVAGYYRTAHNDLFQGEAVSAFLHDTLGPEAVAVIHEGDAYTLGLAQAFRNAFERHNGTITDYIEIDESTDLAELVDQISASNPDAIFFPLYEESAGALTDALRQHGGFENTVLVSADGVLHESYMGLESSEGVYIAGPDLDFGDNTNQATGMNASQAIEGFTQMTGATPVRTFWAHTYDATTLLLDAVTAASRIESRNLVIDRAGIREYLNGVENYQGIIGVLACDEFGDCGSGNISIILHIDSEDLDASRDNVVYRYSQQELSDTDPH